MSEKKSSVSKLLKILKYEGVAGVGKRISPRVASWKLKMSERLNKKVVQSAYGIKLKANYADATFKFYVCGSYGNFYSDLLRGLDEPFYYVDIGANQGLYTILAAKNKNCKGVYAFEPVKDTVDILEANIELNDVSSKVEVIRKAIDEKNGTANIAKSEDHSGVATIATRSVEDLNDSEVIQVINHEELNKLISIKDIPLIVKIDVEGHEETVLIELFKSDFIGQIQQIFYECNESWIDTAMIKNTLKESGFTLQKIGDSETHYDVLANR